MRALLVTYELKATPWDYRPFFEAIKSEPNWWHYINSTWIVITYKTPQQLHQVLGAHLSTKDSILIAEITGSYYGFLAKDAWRWIEEYVPGARVE